jgi:hypothetical protein
MAICHDARKSRHIGSHWSKTVAPPLYSTSSGQQGRRARAVEEEQRTRAKAGECRLTSHVRLRTV